MTNMGRGQLNSQKVTLAMFANQLSRILGRTVLDKTGLEGEYDIRLEYRMEVGQGGGRGTPPGAGPSPEPPEGNDDSPSIFTALQEQLGLRLDQTKGPVEVLVIDRVEKPSDN